MASFSDDLAERVRYGFKIVTCRQPDDEDVYELVELARSTGLSTSKPNTALTNAADIDQALQNAESEHDDTKRDAEGRDEGAQQDGESGAWVSDRLPNLAKHVDDICFIKSMQTDQFNHGPAQLMVHTGQARMGYPSIRSWTTWRLGTENPLQTTAYLPDAFTMWMAGGGVKPARVIEEILA